ncbi:MAG: agmatine deiminase family protein [Candidatus Krumholzibacteriota bacterium]|nr:agmatine deiminase family protein [Candidatus Krumholzibacteriota bacterium]
MATAPPATPIRKCAQWEPVTGVLIRYNNGFGIPYDLIREYAEDVKVYVLCRAYQQSTCLSRLSSNGVNMDNVELLDIRTDSIWTRDYGPQIIFSNGIWGIVDHIYNRPRPYDDQVPVELGTIWGCAVYGTDIIHTGGNFMTDGHGIGFSTDMTWDENPTMTHEEIAQMMEDYLGITNYIIVPDIDPTGIHHIDCWAKILSEETILVKEVPSSHPHYAQLETNVAYLQTLTNCYGRPYNIVRVFSGSIGGDDVAAYTNSLILNNKVFVPTYGISSDADALATYASAMPGYEVLGFADGWLSDDAIHCRGMGIHDRYMLVLDTNPLQDQDINEDDYEVTALIDDRSETGLITDSLLVYWRLEGSSEFNAVVMQETAYPDYYYADIPQQADEVNIEYYVFAKDNSARRATRPMVAPQAWYTFNTGECGLVATLLQGYSAEFNALNITLSWSLSEAGRIMQFHVLRAEAGIGIFRELPHPEIESDGLTFTFNDSSYEPGAAYLYRVEVVDEAGRRILFETDPISTPSLQLTLFQNHPNPFNPSTTIRYYLPERAFVSLKIYDASGREISRLVNREMPEGQHAVDWAGQDAYGKTVASGVYFYSLECGKEIISRKMILLR